jgi:hypothetical protein
VRVGVQKQAVIVNTCPAPVNSSSGARQIRRKHAAKRLSGTKPTTRLTFEIAFATKPIENCSFLCDRGAVCLLVVQEKERTNLQTKDFKIYKNQILNSVK